MKKTLYSVLFCISIYSITNAQLIGPNDADALLGLPQATSLSELNAIIAPQTGALTYNLEDSKIYIFNGTNWVSVTNDNWLVDGNNGLPDSSFLGHKDDVKMEIRSDNLPLLQFGRRETLGLTDGDRVDYDDPTQPLVYVNGDGVTSALQFAASAASFYKPLFYSTTNGNFRLKGSSGRTDFFEIGSSGPDNDGRLEFITGDDGNEPFIFKRFDYRDGQFHQEFFRVQGSTRNANSKTRFGININTQRVPIDLEYDDSSASFNVANSTLQLEGSLSLSILTTTGSLTLTEDHHTIIINGNHNITLPNASTCNGREYILKNQTSASVNISSYRDLSNSTQNNIPANTAYTLQSDGSNWHIINGSITNNNSNPASSSPVLTEAYLTFDQFININNQTTIRINAIRLNSGSFPDFPINVNNEIVIPEDGYYEISYSLTIDRIEAFNTDLIDRNFETNLRLNGNNIVASRLRTTVANDEYNSISKTVILQLSANNRISFSVQRLSGSGNYTILSESAGITVKKL